MIENELIKCEKQFEVGLCKTYASKEIRLATQVLSALFVCCRCGRATRRSDGRGNHAASSGPGS